MNIMIWKSQKLNNKRKWQYSINQKRTHYIGSKQPHEIKIWKNNVSKSKLEIRNKIIGITALNNNEYLLTIISNNKY